jgi:maleylpyruvate isomerase
VSDPREAAAREALRKRQGKGARYDAPNAPEQDLLLARRGTAWFARKLNELRDAELDAPCLREGWTRRHLVVHVSYSARRQAIALKGLREELTPEEAGWVADVNFAATLPARAIRTLFDHSRIHLDVEWRDLRPQDWERDIVIADGQSVPVRSLPRSRAREIWRGAVDLDNGARRSDIPPEIRG